MTRICKCKREYIPGLNGTSQKCDWCCEAEKGIDVAKILTLAKQIELSKKKLFN